MGESGIGTIHFDQPLGLGLAIACAALMALVLLRFGRRGLAHASLLMCALVLALFSAAPRLDDPRVMPPHVFLVDTSASARGVIMRAWPVLRAEITRLAGSVRPAPVAVAFFDGRGHHLVQAAGDHELRLPEDLPESRAPQATDPLAALALLPANERFASLTLVSDWHFPPLVTRALRDRLADPAHFFAIDPVAALRDAVRIERFVALDRAMPGQALRAAVQYSGSASGRAMIEISASHVPGETVRGEAGIAAARAATWAGELPAAWFAQPGPVELRARVSAIGEASGDDLPENDSMLLPVMVGESQPVLYARGPSVNAGGDPLLALLRANTGLPVREIAPASLPRDVAGYLDYRAVVLNDVPAGLLPDRGEALRHAVETRGLGLFVAGAAQAFGPGAYNGAPLEDALPLDANPEPDRTRLRVLLLDASASMGEPFGNGIKFELLVRAAGEVLALLDEPDRVRLMPFAASPLDIPVLAPFVPVDENSRRRLITELAIIAPTGQTFLHGPLESALASVERERIAYQGASAHMLLISDGRDTANSGMNYGPLGERLASAGVRVTVVLLADEEPAWIHELRAGALGRSGLLGVIGAPRLAELPQLMHGHMLDEQRALLHEQGVSVVARPAGAPGGGTLGAPGPISRWVETSLKIKQGAHEALATASEPERPLLAWWRFGAGRAAAVPFACDGGSSALARDRELQRGIAAVIEWIAASETSGPYRLTVERGRDGLVLRIMDAGPPRLRALRGLLLREQGDVPVEFVQEAPREERNRWLARVSGAGEGMLRLKLLDEHGAALAPLLLAAPGYPAEYAPPYTNQPSATVLTPGAALPALDSSGGAHERISDDVRWALGAVLLMAGGLTLWLRRPARTGT